MKRRTWTRVAGTVFAVPAVLLMVVVVGSEAKLQRRYAVPMEASLPLRADSAAVALGGRLVRSVANCVLCHGEDLGGAVYIDGGPLGIVTGPNLTRGRGGIGGRLTDADWERAIRHGVRRDGTSLVVMPSEIYAHMSDQDLGAIIAYLRQVEPVDREVEPTRFRLPGRALLAAGRLPILVAPKTPQVAHADAAPADSVAYGRYLADLGGCHGCHGHGLSGGRVAGPRDLPLASNLTPAGLGDWSEADFVRVMRTGERPDGRVLHEFMPWRVLGRMSDEELHAIWAYLQTVAPRETGTR